MNHGDYKATVMRLWQIADRDALTGAEWKALEALVLSTGRIGAADYDQTDPQTFDPTPISGTVVDATIRDEGRYTGFTREDEKNND